MASRLTSLFVLFVSFLSVANALVKTVTSADGTKIYADSTGDSTKQSIVFVHGFALSGVVFDRLFTNKKLLSNFYLVRYDMRGHGRSDKPNTAEAHTSDKYSQDFTAVSNAFGLKRPVFVGWSLAAAIITDIVANNDVIPIAGAVALDGSPGISADIIPAIASPFLLSTLPAFNTDNDVTAALAIRQSFVDGLFANPASVDFALKAQYFGQTVVQPPDVSALVSMRPQDPTKLFAAGDAGKLPLQVLFGTSDGMVVADGVVSTFSPHFGKNLTVSKIPGGHALFEDNQGGMVDQLTWFVQNVAVPTKKRSFVREDN